MENNTHARVNQATPLSDFSALSLSLIMNKIELHKYFTKYLFKPH